MSIASDRAFADPATPRDAAKNLLRSAVLDPGCSIHQIIRDGTGRDVPRGKGRHAPYGVYVRGHEVIVWRWDGRDCDTRFRLEAIIAEIRAEAAAGVRQAALFEDEEEARE